ncbi:hypothetical protein HDU78_007697 [Chytriomyces hyalinus]|uniref:Uncharacterized protein n=1 Tax=Chytriomyces confervae TaxID=246404 RepID=A0A507DZR2_9FUNG|nr:hypothetical protein HDU78_007697 [Chytriomyces hyalinus]TPX56677.1 hypothetical protein CcCBS67573_g09331 [Chytriomyces confervae]
MTIFIESLSSAGNEERGRERLQFHAKVLFTPSVRQYSGNGACLVRIFNNALVFEDPSVSLSLSINYEAVLIHAISRGDPSNQDILMRPCIYSQLDSVATEIKGDALNGSSNSTGNGALAADDDSDEVDSDACELRIVPDDSTILDSIFEHLTACVALHPDKNALDDEMDDEEGDWMMTADDFNQSEMTEARQAALDHLESVFVGGVRKEADDRFEDADESDAKRTKEDDAHSGSGNGMDGGER